MTTTNERFTVDASFSNDTAKWNYRVELDGEFPPASDFFEPFTYSGPLENVAKGKAAAGNKAIAGLPSSALPVFDPAQADWVGGTL